MPTITKTEIASSVAATLGSSKETTSKVINAVVDEIGIALKGGNDVRLAGLGTFTVKATTARTGRNPMTGEPVEIKAGKKVSFKPSSDLKGKL